MKTEDLRQSIRKARQSQGLSAEKLAELSKSTKSNILNFENGKANITLHLLGKICDALKLSITLQSNSF